MNTNLSMLQEASNTAAAVLQQIKSWPTGLLFAVCLLGLSAALRYLRVPDRPRVITVLLLGVVLPAVAGDVSKLPEHAHPRVVLAMWGFVVACITLVAFKLVVKRFGDRLPMMKDPDDDDKTQTQSKQP